jgi:hypothetical protein
MEDFFDAHKAALDVGERRIARKKINNLAG